MRDRDELDRNCLYNVTATVNALGSEQEEQPKELEATVSAMSWEEGHIYVGEEHPLFLVLNTDGYRISNNQKIILFISFLLRNNKRRDYECYLY